MTTGMTRDWGHRWAPDNLECQSCVYYRNGDGLKDPPWHQCRRYWPLRHAPFEGSPCGHWVEKKR